MQVVITMNYIRLVHMFKPVYLTLVLISAFRLRNNSYNFGHYILSKVTVKDCFSPLGPPKQVSPEDGKITQSLKRRFLNKTQVKLTVKWSLCCTSWK
jgi:hypothetical protein